MRNSPADILSPGSGRSSSTNAKSWEHLLTWWPDYESFAGVFKDIAELPHVAGGVDDPGADLLLDPNDPDVCRPAPLGDRSATIGAEEEYI